MSTEPTEDRQYMRSNTAANSDNLHKTNPLNILNEKIVPTLKPITKRILREEIVEDYVYVDERIVEVANRIIQEKIVEVPEVEYKERIKEVKETRVEETIVEVPKIEYCERIVEVPKYIIQEKYVEVPQIEYRDVITERTINLAEVHQETVINEVEVPQYVGPNGEPIARPIVEIERKIPVPVEAITTYEYQLAQFRPRVTRVKYPMYVPRFIPVPVVAESVEFQKLAEMQALNTSLAKLVGPQAASLTELDDLANTVKQKDYPTNLPTREEAQQTIREKWLTGHIHVAALDQQAPPQSVNISS